MNNIKTIKIATRQSKLALWQSQWVTSQLTSVNPDVNIEFIRLTTKGDKILDKSLSKIGGKGLFVKELEQAILTNTADIAVHSLKDMPAELPEGLELAVYCAREDYRDVLISSDYKDLASMPLGSNIGTSSARRAAQLKIYRPDLNIMPLRGNIDTRINKALDPKSNLDGIILASAGVHRLDEYEVIKQYLPVNNFLPAPGQGVVTIEVRTGDHELKKLLQKISCRKTTWCSHAERAFNRTIGGSCEVPIAALAEVTNENEITLHGQLASTDGEQQVTACITGESKLADDLGERLAEKILKAGGTKILKNIQQQ